MVSRRKSPKGSPRSYRPTAEEAPVIAKWMEVTGEEFSVLVSRALKVYLPVDLERLKREWQTAGQKREQDFAALQRLIDQISKSE